MNKATLTVVYDRDISAEGRANSQARFKQAKSIVDEVKSTLSLDEDVFVESNIMVGESIYINLRAVKKYRKSHVVQTDKLSLKAMAKAKKLIAKRLNNQEYYAY